METTDGWMLIKDVAHRLGFTSAMTIHRLLATDPGFPRGIRIGKLRRWSVEEIEGYIEELREVERNRSREMQLKQLVHTLS